MKFSFYLKVFLVLSATGVLSCSNHPYKNRSTDYVLVKLENYDLSGIELEEDLMPIPPGKIAPFSGKDANFDLPRPQPLALGIKVDHVQIRTRESRKWIWLNWQTAQVWSYLYDFLDAEKLAVTSVDAKKGDLFTKTPNGTLKLSLRQGIVRKTSELHLNFDTKIETSLTDKYREKLVIFLKQKRAKSVSLVGLNLEKKQGAELFVKNRVYLLLDFSLERTLLEMDGVLSQSFTQETKKLEDKNFSKGEFYIKYVSSLADLENSQANDFLYTVKLTSQGKKTKVDIFTRKLKVVEKAIAEEILRFIQRQFQ